MIVGNVARRAALAFVLAGSAAATLPATTVSVQAASEIKAVVNGMPITSYQIRQRAAFLKLRRVGGNATQKATDELIDEALKKQEIGRRGIAIPDEAVDEAGDIAVGDHHPPRQLAEQDPIGRAFELGHQSKRGRVVPNCSRRRLRISASTRFAQVRRRSHRRSSAR